MEEGGGRMVGILVVSECNSDTKLSGFLLSTYPALSFLVLSNSSYQSKTPCSNLGIVRITVFNLNNLQQPNLFAKSKFFLRRSLINLGFAHQGGVGVCGVVWGKISTSNVAMVPSGSDSPL